MALHRKSAFTVLHFHYSQFTAVKITVRINCGIFNSLPSINKQQLAT